MSVSPILVEMAADARIVTDLTSKLLTQRFLSCLMLTKAVRQLKSDGVTMITFILEILAL